MIPLVEELNRYPELSKKYPFPFFPSTSETEPLIVKLLDPLIEKYRQQILSLAHEHGVSNVRVFGSMVRNEANEESDIDLLVELDEGKSGFALGGFLEDVAHLVNRKVDVLDKISKKNGVLKSQKYLLLPKLISGGIHYC